MAKERRTVDLELLLADPKTEDMALELEAAMGDLEGSKAVKAEMDAADKQVKAKVKEIMGKLEIDGVNSDRGSLSVTETTRTSYGRDPLVKAMLEKGIDTDTITMVLEKAGKVSTSVAVSFRPKK